MRVYNDVLIAGLSSASTLTSTTADLRHHVLWDATVTITDLTPTASTFVYLSGNNFTDTAHTFITGLKAGVANSGGALPTGLTATNYYVIVVDANTFALASSLANALAGTAVTITGAGTGTQTITPSALAGTFVWQKSDTLAVPTPASMVWFTIVLTSAASQNITATSLNYYDPAAGYPSLRGLATFTGGQGTVTATVNCKGT